MPSASRWGPKCWPTKSPASGGRCWYRPPPAIISGSPASWRPTRNSSGRSSNGLASCSELLWTEHTAGPGAVESQFREHAVEALTVDNVPVIQSGRMEDYSPELWALTGSKGAAVLHMLRFVVGDQNFTQT